MRHPPGDRCQSGQTFVGVQVECVALADAELVSESLPRERFPVTREVEKADRIGEPVLEQRYINGISPLARRSPDVPATPRLP